MTDQIDTDALREVVLERSSVLNMDEVAIVDAAADEMDRLRKELDKAVWDSREATNTAEYERRRAEKYERELDQLREVIEDAPHMESCRMSYLSTYPTARCTCWKADAL
jgi:hypothetical protein